jgi:phage I-like protein
MNRKTPQLQQKNTGIAACAISVTSGNEIQLFPAGEFRAIDGRPKDAPHWLIDAALAAAIIKDFEARQNKTVVDYEHQTILTAENGQPAPAAGWFSRLEWRDTGLYAVDVEWTQRATNMIEAGEYKYISPVFTYDKKTGAIKSLLNAALTNNPALDGMDAVAANLFFNTKENDSMEKLLNNLRWLLNMPVTATQDEIEADLQKAIDQIKSVATSVTSAPGFDIVSMVKAHVDQIAALTASVNNPDPAKFVAVATMQALQNQVADLLNRINQKEVDEVVTAALASGKILPDQEAWARQHGKENLVSLKKYLETAQPIAALKNTQTGGNPPADKNNPAQLTDSQLAICKATGVAPEDFLKTLQDDQAQS